MKWDNQIIEWYEFDSYPQDILDTIEECEFENNCILEYSSFTDIWNEMSYNRYLINE